MSQCFKTLQNQFVTFDCDITVAFFAVVGSLMLPFTVSLCAFNRRLIITYHAIFLTFGALYVSDRTLFCHQ